MSDETTPNEIPAEEAEEMSPEEVVEFTPEESEPVTEEEVLDSGFPTLEQLAALLPQYEFHDILGVGGMGAVYLARQAALDRWVAIKLLPQSASLNAEDASRFITEARSMAKLTHANIAAVYDFGQTVMGHLYLVMEHIQGLDLHRLIHRNEVTAQRIRSLVPQLCDALQYAHDHGVIHRDIKPANILITQDWQAKIVDFGLAGDGAVTAGEFEYGTPEYVAPERLEQGATVDHRADIYALGVVIHEMFTKTTPLAAGSSAFQGMPEAFGSVVARCTAPDPAKRFQRCSEIKSYLAIADQAKPAAPMPAGHHAAAPPHLSAQSHLKKPQSKVSIEPQGNAEAAKWLWAAAVVLLVSGGYWFIQKQREKGLIADAEAQNQARAAAKADSAAKADPKADTTKKDEKAPDAADAKKADETAKAPEMAANTPEPETRPNSPETAPKEEPAFKPEPGDFAVLKRLTGHNSTTHSAAIFPDQGRVATFCMDDTIRIWSVATGKMLQSYRSPLGEVLYGKLSKDGRRALIDDVDSDQSAIIEIDSGKVLYRTRAPNSHLISSVWSADEKDAYVLTAEVDGGIFHWQPRQGENLTKLDGWNRGAYQMAFLPGGRFVVTGADVTPSTSSNAPAGAMTMGTMHAAIFQQSDHRRLQALTDYTLHCQKLRLSPDGSRLACMKGRNLGIFDTQTMTPSAVPVRSSNVSGLEWTPDGRFLILGHSSGEVRICEAETDQEVASLNVGTRITSISISRDQSWAVVSGFSPLPEGQTAAPDLYDVFILRLPDLSKMGTEKGRLAIASRQLADLKQIDAELAALRDSAVTAADAITTDELLIAAVRDLTTKYGLALKRAAATASPKDQIAMNAEASSVASGAAVPGAFTDAATAGEHKRFRGIYRQQIAALETKRQQGMEQARKSIEGSVRQLASKRQAAGDSAGAARCEALLASYGELKPFADVIATAFTPSAASTPTVAATSTPNAPTPALSTPSPAPSTGAVKLQRIGKPGELLKIERSTKNGDVRDNRSRVGSVPPTIGPVYQVAANNYHGLAILADGSLKGWGSWSSGGAVYATPADVKDAVMIATSFSESAAVLGDGSVFIWNEGGNSRKWTPPGGITVASITSEEDWGMWITTTDGKVYVASSYGLNNDSTPPSDLKDVVSVTGDDDQTGIFAVNRDGIIHHWGKENLYIGQQHLNVKDGLSVAESNNFLCVLHKDGTVDGWGEVQGRQKFRVRKYPGALRVLPDPAGRIFLVEKPGAEWAVQLNPANYEYYEEQRLGNLEGKLKGCTSVALSSLFVFGVKTQP